MPSQLLGSISTQIENKGQNNFHKFFLYARLLSYVSDRQQDINLFGTLPKINTSESADNLEFPTANFDVNFIAQIQNYQELFNTDNSGPLQWILNNYCRTSQLADLSFIVDKMLNLWSSPDLEPTTEHQESQLIYNRLHLSEPKVNSIAEFIRVHHNLCQKALLGIDITANGFWVIPIMLTGIFLSFAFLSSLVSILISSALICVAALTYTIFIFPQRVEVAMNNLDNLEQVYPDNIRACLEKMFFGSDGDAISFMSVSFVGPVLECKKAALSL